MIKPILTKDKYIKNKEIIIVIIMKIIIIIIIIVIMKIIIIIMIIKIKIGNRLKI